MRPKIIICRGRRCLLGATAFFGLVGVSLAFSAPGPAHAQVLSPEQYNIVTVAGTGVAGFNDDHIPAVAAQLNIPGFVVFDSMGNMFITDNTNHRIRKVDAAGIITTVVGTGVQGFNGDNIPATAAQIFLPRGLTFDSMGNLLVSDLGNGRLRMVRPGSDGALGVGDSGQEIITTIAGGGPLVGAAANGQAATAASLNSPGFTVFDAGGNLYLSEVGGNRIWKIARSPDAPLGDGNIDGDLDEIITIVAGTGAICTPSTNSCGDGGPATAAQFLAPNGIDLDSAGNLYIADVNTHRVRFVNLGTTDTTIAGQTVHAGNIATIAGTGVRCPLSTNSCGDEGLATAAQLAAVRTVTLDSSGNLFIADFADHRIRFLNLGSNAITISGKTVQPGHVTTVVGTGVQGVAGNGGLATEAQLVFPNAVTFDAAGNLYIAEALSGHRVRRLNLATPVTVDPGTLNLKSKGQWNTATIQFPAGLVPSGVDLSSVMLQAIHPENGALRVEDNAVLQTARDDDSPSAANDTDGDLVLKYLRETVIGWALGIGGDSLSLRVEGQLNDGRFFSGDTAIGVKF